MSLPSYEAAVQPPSVIFLLADYLDTPSLKAASCVNREWYMVTSGKLWEDPIRTIISSGGSPFSRTYTFINDAAKYTEQARSKVLSLNFDPLTVLYYQHQDDWVFFEDLFSCRWVISKIKHFPKLKSLVTDGLPYFAATGQPNESEPDMRSDNKLALFSCKGTGQFPLETWYNSDWLNSVMYFDVSYTVQNPSLWERAFTPASLDGPQDQMFELRVLKLRGMRIGKLPKMPGNASPNKLIWSLDVRDNLLIDNDIYRIIDLCLPNFEQPNMPSANVQLQDLALYEMTPEYTQHGDYLPTHPRPPLRSDTNAGFLSRLEQHGEQESVLPSSDPYLLATGLTHIHLSGNKFTSTSISRLLSSTNRLQVLSIGSVLSPQPIVPHTKSYHLLSFAPLPGTRLSILHIHHSIITGIPTIVRSSLSDGFLLPLLPQAETYLPANFLLSDHPALISLTLTDIPTLSTGPLITRLCAFLKQCAEQEVAIAAAATAPALAHRRAPRLLSGLRNLRLEFLPASEEGKVNVGSVSGHEDAERFRREVEGDFSFFGGSGGGGEQKEKEKETEKYKHKKEKVLDVVEELRKWRRKEVPRWGGKLEVVVVGGRKRD